MAAECLWRPSLSPVLPVTRGAGTHDSARGFTLMEVLVAMTLLALLMTALSGSIGFVGRSWDRGWETAKDSAAFSRVESTIRRMVEQSLPVSIRAPRERQFLFEGTATGIRLVAYDAPGGSAGALYVQEIGVRDKGGQRQFLYRRYPFKDDSALPESIAEAQMLTGAFSVMFSYFGSPRPSEPLNWFDSWTSDRRLPDLVRVRIKAGGETAWPPIIARPFITAEFDCIRPTDAGLCRLEKAAQ